MRFVSFYRWLIVLFAGAFLSCAHRGTHTVDSADSLALQRAIFAAEARAMPALINIQPISEVFTRGKKERQTGIGSGVIVSPEGYAITNYHVAANATVLICTLTNQEKVNATLVGSDPLTDIAVIRLEPRKSGTPYEYVPLGDSSKLRRGEYVLALGSPLALDRTVSLGVVSCENRYIPDKVRLPTGETTGTYNTWIQTDAAINPGNSGGPLINLRGEVVGINARTVLFANDLGFAIPINIVRRVYDAILADGKVTRAWIGLDFQPLQPLEAYFMAGDSQGVLVSSVAEDSPARAAGLREGDVLLSIEKEPVKALFDEDIPEIQQALASLPVGATVEISYRRQGNTETVRVVPVALGAAQAERFEAKKWGFTVKGITKQMMMEERLEDALGVMVVGVSSLSLSEGNQLSSGDVIRDMAGKSVEDLESFKTLYRELVEQQQKQILMKIKRSDAMRFVLVNPTD